MDKCKIMKLVPIEYTSNIIPEENTKIISQSKFEKQEYKLPENNTKDIGENKKTEETILYAPRKIVVVKNNLKLVKRKNLTNKKKSINKLVKRKINWEEASDSE